jgi:hypothetical protein
VKHKIVLLLAVAAIVSISAVTSAQDTATPPPATAVAPDLSSLPDADLVVYMNPAKIVNEAMPKLVPAKQLTDLNNSLDQLKKMLSVDPRKMSYIALAARMRKPVGAEPVPLPEYLLVIKGGVGAGTLMGLLQLGGQNVHTEKYGSHDLYTYTVKDIAKKSEQLPLLGSYAEFGLTILHDDMYVAGTTGFVKAAIDADEGRGRLKPQLAQSIVRDPENLISISGSLLTGLARSIALIDSARPGAWDCLNSFGQGYLALRQTESGLRITGALNGDNPETAGILKNMITFLLKQAESFVPDPEMKTVLQALHVSVEGNEIVGSGDISQTTINSWLEKKTPPPPPAAVAQPAETQTVTAGSVAPKRATTRKRKPRSH